jgi:hypothetical protein
MAKKQKKEKLEPLRKQVGGAAGTQFTCFIGTKVQLLTQQGNKFGIRLLLMDRPTHCSTDSRIYAGAHEDVEVEEDNAVVTLVEKLVN